MTNSVKFALCWIIEVLEKHAISYQISGGFAAYLYGSKRPINDIDIEIPETDLEKIIPDVRKYITYGPEQYIDERWDCIRLCLNYDGVEIDISGAYDSKIFDDSEKKWIESPVDFNTSVPMEWQGLHLKVVDPKELIAYKKLCIGNHQKTDIEAVEKYMKSKKS